MSNADWGDEPPQDDVPGMNQPWDTGDGGPSGGRVPPPPPAPPNSGNFPARSPEDIRTWTMLAHASAYIAVFLGGLAFLGPLVVWLIRKDVDEISGLHAKEALNFNLSVMIYGGVSLLLAVLLIGIPMLIALGIFWMINVLRAILAVSNGQTFAYPLTIRFL